MLSILSSCAGMPENKEGQATFYTAEATDAIIKGDENKAGENIYGALYRPTGDIKIKALFAKYPKGQDYYQIYLEKNISEITNTFRAKSVFETISIAKSAGIFSETQLNNLFTKLNNLVIEGNKNGSIPFEFGDSLEQFPELKTATHQQIIANRTIKYLQSGNPVGRSVNGLMDYIKQIGIQSPEAKRIESLLPSLNIRNNELIYCEKLFPVFAKNRKEAITARIFVQYKNIDRLLADDLTQIITKNIPGIEWMNSADGEKVISIEIERIRNDEKILPERSQTITYGQYEVDSTAAVLLMPRNASYLYDIITGGAEIEYGYVVTAHENGKKILDDVIRGKSSSTYLRCQNMRIQNVFGGISSAGFMANDKMKQQCSSNPVTSIEILRNEVYTKVANSLLKIAPIKRISDLN